MIDLEEIKTEKEELNGRSVIKHLNKLNYIKHNLSQTALDIFYLLIAQIKLEDKFLFIHSISINDLETKLGKQEGKKLNRISLKNAIKELSENNIIFTDNTKGFKYTEICILDTKKSLLQIKLSEELNNYLIKLNSGNYVMANLDSFLKLNGKYPKILYMLFSQYTEMSKFNMKLSLLNQILDTPSSIRSTYGNFKQRVLDSSIKEIKKLSDFIDIKYKVKKRGNTVISIDFTVIGKERIIKKRNSKTKSTSTEYVSNPAIESVNDWIIMRGNN